MGARGRKRLAVAAIVCVGLAYATLIQSFSWNQTSHYDLLRSLDSGTTTIDATSANTGDKVLYRGHWYSARAPGTALFVMPWYDVLNGLDAQSWAQSSPAQRNDDEMIYLVGLWGNVLPGVLLVALVFVAADALEPGFGLASALALGLGTMALPLSTLLFSHIFTAFLGFAAFLLMMRERAGPPSASLLGLAGLTLGYALSSEYPLGIVAIVLGIYMLSRRDALRWRMLARRVLPFALGVAIGLVPLLLYNHAAFGSWTHVAYSDVPRQQHGFFGITLPSVPVLATLLLDSRGLLTLSPVLIMGGVGTWLLGRRGRRAEAWTIAAICVAYVLYNSGYYLPFGGGFMGPRFLATLLPFLALPIAVALRRFPGPTIALGAISATATALATMTHPLVGYETETYKWTWLLGRGLFQPTIASAYGLGLGWTGIWPFLVAIALAVGFGVAASARVRLDRAGLLAGIGCLAGWMLYAWVGPTLLGLDHRGLLDIAAAGDMRALHKPFPSYPLSALAPLAAGVGLLALGAARLLRSETSGARDHTSAADVLVA